MSDPTRSRLHTTQLLAARRRPIRLATMRALARPPRPLTPEGPAAALAAEPASLTLEADGHAVLRATVRDARGRLLPDAPVWWSTSGAAVATVDSATGRVSAVGVGQTNVVGHSGAALVEVPVSVALASVKTLRVVRVDGTALPEVSLPRYGQTTVSATAVDANGVVLIGRLVGWHTEDPGVATVDTAGTVAALRVGRTVLVASSGGASARACRSW